MADPVTTRSSIEVISRDRTILIQFTGSEPMRLLAYSMQSAHIVHEMDTPIDMISPVNIVVSGVLCGGDWNRDWLAPIPFAPRVPLQ